MEAQDILLTFAEISVALAGFIGIAAAFRQRSGSWSPRDVSVVRYVLEVSFSALFLSVLPGILANFSVEIGVSWRISAVIMAVFLLLLFIHHGRRRARLADEGVLIRSIPFRRVMLFGYLVVTAALALSGIFGVVVTGIYLLGVTMLLLAAAIEFLAFAATLQE